MMAEKGKVYHTYPKRTMLLRDVVAMIRPAGYSNYDALSETVVLCPECEEWTWVEFNVSNGMLDLLGNLIVDSFNATEDGKIQIWIETDEFNWFKQGEKNDQR